MASILRSPPLVLPPAGRSSRVLAAPKSLPRLNLHRRAAADPHLEIARFSYQLLPSPRFMSFVAYGEATETGQVEETAVNEEESEDEVNVEDGAADGGIAEAEEKTSSAVMASLQLYKEALANDDQSTVAEIESFLLSIEGEKESLAKKISSLSEELSVERERVLRISADFDNFRKRTERERLSLMTNVRGEVIESLLPVLDNFERAKTQIKVETEGEEKINNSYQSIYKQFLEVLDSLGVEAVETVGIAFDPMLHEAIMREDSTEFEEGIVLQEFRKGFKLGERLLRPSMVKVSAGPGPQNTEEAVLPTEEEKEDSGESNSDITENGEESD